MTENVSNANVLAAVLGKIALRDDDKNVVAEMAGTLMTQVVNDGSLIRKTNYAIGREFDMFERVEFFTLDDNDQRTVLATATCDASSWHIDYADGKEHKPEELIVTRSEARKPSSSWDNVTLENGARDTGPDFMKMAGAALGALGLITRAERNEIVAAKSKLAAADAEYEALIAGMKAMGLPQDQIDQLVENAKKAAAEKIVQAEAERQAKNAAKKAKPAAK